ncbi:MAG: phosphoglycerate dehydrogenase [Treponema sp.]|nr:phosphoglycerate dehydrogenase [Treponema sp.]
MYKIQTLNKISPIGLERFSRSDYEVASSIADADAILVRSAEMHGMTLPETVKAVARAGAGVNNIPISELTERGIVVFNTPGANANAVKELALLSLLVASRPVIAAHAWIVAQADKGEDIPDVAEKGKSQFVGPELKGKTLGVIGLGAIGAMVANMAVALGMHVVGYDPFISVASAWRLDTTVKNSETLDTLLKDADYLTIHMPQTDETKGFINAEKLAAMKSGVRIINLSRGGLVNNRDMLKALDSGKVACFVSDFATAELLTHPKVLCFPHLGASTPEAEDNCAVMAINELRDFLERGVIVNAVNFPKCVTDNAIPVHGTRLCISHRNIPGMVSQFTTTLSEANLNIASLINNNKGDVAYTLIDVDSIVAEQALRKLAVIDGVLKVRPLFG